MQRTEEWFSWLSLALGTSIIGVYELRLWMTARRDPAATARSAHRVLRADWVSALSRQTGSEIIAVQTLRNSLMSATITASTAAVSLMGAVSLLAARHEVAHPPLRPPLVLELSLVVSLFAAYVCSAMAMRYYHHTSFLMSLPVGSPERTSREVIAASYVQRAGLLYGWSLRCFLFVAPLVLGLMRPWFMPLGAVVLVWTMRKFDRAPEPL